MATGAKKKLTVRGISPSAKVSFPRLFTPEAMEKGGKKKYQITLSFKPSELEGEDLQHFKEMVEAANAVSKDLFGVGYKETFTDEDGVEHSIRSPFRSGKTSKFHDDDEIFIRFSSEDRPGVVDGSVEPITEESGQVYPGMIARVSWSCSAYSRMNNNGVTFYLGNVQKTGKGERLVGGPSAEEVFDKVEPEEPENAESTATDEVPF